MLWSRLDNHYYMHLTFVCTQYGKLAFHIPWHNRHSWCQSNLISFSSRCKFN